MREVLGRLATIARVERALFLEGLQHGRREPCPPHQWVRTSRARHLYCEKCGTWPGFPEDPTEHDITGRKG